MLTKSWLCAGLCTALCSFFLTPPSPPWERGGKNQLAIAAIRFGLSVKSFCRCKDLGFEFHLPQLSELQQVMLCLGQVSRSPLWSRWLLVELQQLNTQAYHSILVILWKRSPFPPQTSMDSLSTPLDNDTICPQLFDPGSLVVSVHLNLALPKKPPLPLDHVLSHSSQCLPPSLSTARYANQPSTY